MATKKKEKEAEVQVTFYDVANKRTYQAPPSKHASKETVNLCMREKTSISYELFFLLLAVIFIILVIVEFFGVYRPYLAVERAEADLAEKQTQLEQIYDSMSNPSREEVRDNYRRYNYENFPREIVNREEILALLEETVFEKGKITSAALLENNTVELTVSGVLREDIEPMQQQLNEKEGIVDWVEVSHVNFEMDDTGAESATLSMTIRLVPADQGGN